MLNAFWNLVRLPFDKSIKPENLFISAGLKELNSRLEYMKQQRGIMLLSGEPGSGKTSALRAFAARLPELSFKCFYVPLATVNVLDFYRQLNTRLGGEPFFFKSRLYQSIQERIGDLVTHEQKIPVIIFDEAHLLKNENFIELQLITNFNIDSLDPALVVLAGQPHLADRLIRPYFKSFHQRITLKYHLPALAPEEINPFIEHHLKLAGCTQSPFTENALMALYKNTSGLPRLVGALALKTMTLGALEKITELTEEHVFRAFTEL